PNCSCAAKDCRALLDRTGEGARPYVICGEVWQASTDGLFLELPQANNQQQDIKEQESQKHRHSGQMREPWHQHRTQSLTGIDERVDEHSLLQDGELVERAPGIVSTAEKNHWRNHHAEHQSDMLLVYAAA